MKKKWTFVIKKKKILLTCFDNEIEYSFGTSTSSFLLYIRAQLLYLLCAAPDQTMQ